MNGFIMKFSAVICAGG